MRLFSNVCPIRAITRATLNAVPDREAYRLPTMLSMTGKVDASPAPTSTIPMAARAKSGEKVSSAKPNESDEEFSKRKAAAIKARDEIIEKNNKIHNDILNRNWEEVFNSFLIESNRYNAIKTDRKSTRLNSSHPPESRMPSSA